MLGFCQVSIARKKKYLYKINKLTGGETECGRLFSSEAAPLDLACHSYCSMVKLHQFYLQTGIVKTKIFTIVYLYYS